MPGSIDLYSGRRLSYDGALCTVRCKVDSIPGTNGEWVGVEWDDTSRGKHNGTHKSIKYFECRSSHPTAASFIRPSRKPDLEQTVLAAIRSKYVADPSHQSTNGAVTISGKVAQEIGFDKIIQQQSVLVNLKIAILDFMNISGVAPRNASSDTAAQAIDELARTCPNIVELDLSYNPIEKWSDIESMCAVLPKLRILRLNVRLRNMESEKNKQHIDCFRHVQELHLNECLIQPAEVLQILRGPAGDRFPSLHSLWLSQNEYMNFDLPTVMTQQRFESIRTLVFENNFFTSLDPLASICSVFPNTAHVTLQSNRISTFGMALASSGQSYTSLVNLNLAQNSITSFEFVDLISHTFPNLTALRISKNPVYETRQANNTSIKQTETSYYLTLARIPNLKTLNYTDITPRERDEGEIYYLSIAEKDIRTTINEAQNKDTAITKLQHKYPRYNTLCEKHDRENLIQQLLSPSPTTNPHSTTSQPTEPVYPPGSVASRLVKATFHMHDPSSPQSRHREFSRDIPKTIATSGVFALVSRGLNLKPLSFKLVYESEELDPVRDDLTTRSQVHGDRAKGVTRWDDWGDWDADALVERSLRLDDEGRESEGVWKDGVLVKDGRKWRRREVDVLFGMRSWGDWLEDGVKVCRVRVEPVERRKVV